MVSHKEMLRLKSLGPSNTDVASVCGCGRNTACMPDYEMVHRENA